MKRTLDRLPSPHDSRDMLFEIAPRVEKRKPISNEWKFAHGHELIMDQGEEGACVGFGLGYELALDPAPCPEMNNTFARRIYFAAQQRDKRPGGAYPGAKPHYEGTDLRSGLKVLCDAGACDTYERAYNVETTILGIGYNGPAVFGMMWTEGMSNPDAHGFIRPTGRQIGGHCLCGRAVNIEEDFIQFPQSWGRRHGVNGEIKMRLSHVQWLMDRDCEVYFTVGRKPITMDNLPPEILASWWARFFGWR
jgi:hypothetical protein